MIDEEAFHALYLDTAAPLRAYVARVLGSVGQADDIVQEAYLRVLRMPLSAGSPIPVRAYLFRAASNLIVDHFRRRKRESPLAEAPERAAPASDPLARIDMARVFRQLRVRDRQLLWLAHVEGADYHELAKALGLREGSVRVLLSRARRKLAALIEARERCPTSTR